MTPGTLVRVWTGDNWRPARYEGTIERGKRFGWRRVSVRKLNEDGTFRWREIRVRPDNVKEMGA